MITIIIHPQEKQALSSARFCYKVIDIDTIEHSKHIIQPLMARSYTVVAAVYSGAVYPKVKLAVVR